MGEVERASRTRAVCCGDRSADAPVCARCHQWAQAGKVGASWPPTPLGEGGFGLA